MAKRFAVALMLMLAVAGIATPVRSQDMVCMTIAETAVSAGLSTLVAAVDAVGLLPVVSDANTALTVLAPTDEAFADLLSAFNLTLEEVVADVPLLTNILNYHLIDGPVFSSQLTDGQIVPTLLDDGAATLNVSLADGVTFIGAQSDATVLIPDVVACKSVVHVIDAVLVPEFEEECEPFLAPCTIGVECCSETCFGDPDTSGFFLPEAFRTCSLF